MISRQRLQLLIVGFSKADDYGKYVSYACDLGDLNDSQLKELEKRVGEKYTIRVCKDWNADCDVHYVILLITDTDYENLDPAIQIGLGGMKNQYEQAIKDADEIVAPLKHCINIAEKINGKENPHGKKLSDKSAGADPPSPKTSPPSGPATNFERDKRLYELSFEKTLTWGDIAAMVNDEFPNEPLNAKSAPVAAKRYAKNNKGLKPVPRRKAGRKFQG